MCHNLGKQKGPTIKAKFNYFHIYNHAKKNMKGENLRKIEN